MFTTWLLFCAANSVHLTEKLRKQILSDSSQMSLETPSRKWSVPSPPPQQLLPSSYVVHESPRGGMSGIGQMGGRKGGRQSVRGGMGCAPAMQASARPQKLSLYFKNFSFGLRSSCAVKLGCIGAKFSR